MLSILLGLGWAFYGFILGGLIPIVFYFLLYSFLSFVIADSDASRYINKYVEPIKVIQICALIGSVYGFFFGFTY
jgi:uncharacterized protein YqgC (DUF456 family)